MSPNYTFTTAERANLPRILEIFAEAIRAEYDVSNEVFQRCLDNLADSFYRRQYDFNFFVAKEISTGKVVGWVSYLPIFNSILKQDTALEMSIYLDSDYRANGLGYDLVTQTLLEFKGSSFSHIYGFLNNNKSNAKRMVAKLGFKEIGIIPASPLTFPYDSEKALFIYELK